MDFLKQKTALLNKII